MRKSCGLCNKELTCTCGTWDRLHESSCELNAIRCEACDAEYDEGLGYYNEPDEYADHVKDLSIDEIDELTARYRIGV